MDFEVPTRHNKKLQQLVDRINADVELKQLWKCANVNAVDRFKLKWRPAWKEKPNVG